MQRRIIHKNKIENIHVFLNPKLAKTVLIVHNFKT